MTFFDKMNTRQFTYLVVAAFITGLLLLVVVQYNSSANINQLISGNAQLLKEIRTTNRLREIERDIVWVESRIRGAIATDDISHIEGIDSKITEVKNYLDSLRTGNSDPNVQRYIERLRVLAINKLENKNEMLDDYQDSGKMDDTSIISNPSARSVSNEISTLTRKIYDSRQKMTLQLSQSVEESGKRARLLGGLMIALIMISGSLWLWFIIGRIRKQNHLIELLDVADKKTREAAAVKENFLANMSHEIRTPLNAILGFTNLLKQRKMDKEPEEFVAAIQKSGESLLTIINDILDLSKIEAGMMRIESTPFSVRGLFDSVRTLFGEKVKEKQLALQLEINPDVPDTLIGDATRLTQILVNLISNAIKFTSKGKIGINISNGGIRQNTIALQIAVRDTGIGIEKNKLAGIFGRFQQAEASTTRNYGGTGLGLSIVKDLLDLQQGRIEVDSEIGQGTTFTITIPYQISAEQFTELSQSDISFLNENPAAIGKLLVVDDNEMNQSLMKHLLQSWKLEHDIAGNASEALQLLAKNDYGLVLMDIQMPGMDGYEATQYIRKTMQLNVPIVAMTAHALAGEREKCLSHGMNEYLSKPIVEQKLYDFIMAFTARSKGEEKPEIEGRANQDPYQTIDLTYLKSIGKDNIEYHKKAASQFLRLLPKAVDEIDLALIEEDLTTLHATAHNLKTTGSIMGLTEKLNKILQILEFSEDRAEIIPAFENLREIAGAALAEAKHFHDSL